MNATTNNYGYDLYGIGDGCTLKKDLGAVTYNAEWIPNIHFFKGTFTGSCDRHDKCLTQIGNDSQSCHSEFYSNMRNACDDKYKWYQPVERAICKDTAYQYYATVQSVQKDDNTFEMQKATRLASQQVQAQIEAASCGSDPTRLQLFSNGFINEINNSFLTYSGRYPTIFEFMNAANSANYNSEKSAWYSNLQRLSINAASVYVPLANYYADTNFGLNLIASLPGLGYYWRVNNRTGYNQSISLYSSAPTYNTTVRAQGFLMVHAGTYSSRNMVIIDQSYTLLGSCGPKAGVPCY